MGSLFRQERSVPSAYRKYTLVFFWVCTIWHARAWPASLCVRMIPACCISPILHSTTNGIDLSLQCPDRVELAVRSNIVPRIPSHAMSYGGKSNIVRRTPGTMGASPLVRNRSHSSMKCNCQLEQMVPPKLVDCTACGSLHAVAVSIIRKVPIWVYSVVANVLFPFFVTVPERIGTRHDVNRPSIDKAPKPRVFPVLVVLGVAWQIGWWWSAQSPRSRARTQKKYFWPRLVKSCFVRNTKEPLPARLALAVPGDPDDTILILRVTNFPARSGTLR